MRTLTSKQKIGIALFLLFFASVKLGMLWWWQHEQTATPPVQPVPAGCQVALQGCPFAGGATFRLIGVGADTEPFSIEAEGVPESIHQISVSFSMKNMDMGFNRYDLQPQGQGRWRLDNVRLPFCTAARNDWIVHWQTGSQHHQAEFQTR